MGNAGSDALEGGGGADRMMGDAGNDTFVFDTPLVADVVTAIVDFTHGADNISLAASVFSAAGPSGTLSDAAFFAGNTAHDANDRIVYEAATGLLAYDGDGAGATTVFAAVTPGSILSASDFHIL